MPTNKPDLAQRTEAPKANATVRILAVIAVLTAMSALGSHVKERKTTRLNTSHSV